MCVCILTHSCYVTCIITYAQRRVLCFVESQISPADYGHSTFPVIVFAHGLGGTEEVYSTLTTDLASHGWVVISVGHHDGSASGVIREDGTVIDCIVPTPEVIADRERGFAFRNGQLNRRVAECRLALERMQQINAGTFTTTITTDIDPCLHALTHRLDFTRLAIGGHSFGMRSFLYFSTFIIAV
jgi:platelet-activating factor acetylhydrolase